MKKMLTLLLAVTMLLSLTVAAADNLIELDENVTTGNTTVAMTIDASADSYTFTIPAAVTIDPETQYGYGNITLKAGWKLVSANGIRIRLSGAANGVKNGYNATFTSANNQNFTMKTADGSQSATYAIQVVRKYYNTTAVYLTSGTTDGYAQNYSIFDLISVSKSDDSTKDRVTEMTFYVRTLPTAGTYTDTLTFAVTTK